MFIPLTSDGELKYWPIMTGIMIFLNLLAYPIQHALPDRTVEIDVRKYLDDDAIREILRAVEPESTDQEALPDGPIYSSEEVPGWWPLALSHGEGIHPLQWLTSMFMHGSLGHLIGNMIFLWVFGLVVEGRIGAGWFALLYLGCGLLQNCCGQIMFLMSPAPPSLGASGVIYSLMLIAAVWAPGDNIQALLGFVYYYTFVNIPVLILAAFYFLWDFGSSMFQSFELGTPLLHITGGVVGLVVGVTALAMDWVDCDQRDLWSRFQENRGKTLPPPKPKKKTRAELSEEAADQKDHAARVDVVDRSIAVYLEQGKLKEAFSAMKQRRKLLPRSLWNEPQLIRIITLLQQEKRWDDVLHHIEDYLARFESKSIAIRLNQARILLDEKQRPRKCLDVLKQIDQTWLHEKQRAAFARLAKSASARVAAGDLDFAD